MIILGESILTWLKSLHGDGPGTAVAPIPTSGAIQRSRACFVNAGHMHRVYDENLMPFIGQLPHYSGSLKHRGMLFLVANGLKNI
jgi:hypothetical protein